jgi:uncharacterized membrane protein
MARYIRLAHDPLPILTDQTRGEPPTMITRIPTAFLVKLLSDLRASYWFVPASLVVVAVALALGAAWVDRNPSVLPWSLPDAMLNTQVDGARAVLTVIASAMIGVAGVMFSVTIVAVSFASGKYGPRLIGNFMRDRGNQWSMGLLISTFVYALLVLREVQGTSAQIEGFVPQYALWLAILLALVSVATMIYFVHHIPETINVSRITETLGRRLSVAVGSADLAPARAYDFKDPDHTRATGETGIMSAVSGYVQTVDVQGLAACAEQHGARITLIAAPGAFVAVGDVLLRIETDTLNSDDIQALVNKLALGSGQTEEQNSVFLANQLVEMLARALSPGVNDPFTAINCLNWLYAALVCKAQTEVDIPRHDLLDLPRVSFTDLLDAGFGDSLDYVKTDRLATEHFKSLLTRLRDHASGPDKAAVTRLAKSL